MRWPARFARLQNARNRWEWNTTRQEHCVGREVPTPQGKLVGGGSAVNGMVYIRGNPRDCAPIRMGREIMNAPSFRHLHGGEVFPGADVVSDAGLGDYVRAFGKTDYHPVGTCRMGHDDLAVVDPALRVRGIEGLRVADNSIMPSIVSGNTNAPAIMIGERAAAFIHAEI